MIRLRFYEHFCSIYEKTVHFQVCDFSSFCFVWFSFGFAVRKSQKPNLHWMESFRLGCVWVNQIIKWKNRNEGRKKQNEANIQWVWARERVFALRTQQRLCTIRAYFRWQCVVCEYLCSAILSAVCVLRLHRTLHYTEWLETKWRRKNSARLYTLSHSKIIYNKFVAHLYHFESINSQSIFDTDGGCKPSALVCVSGAEPRDSNRILFSGK